MANGPNEMRTGSRAGNGTAKRGMIVAPGDSAGSWGERAREVKRSSRPCGQASVTPFCIKRRDRCGRDAMTQTTGRFFDEIGRLMNDAAGVAQGVRREFDTLFRSQAERILRDLDVVSREEFEAVKDMARLAREENEALKARIAALEARVDRTT